MESDSGVLAILRMDPGQLEVILRGSRGEEERDYFCQHRAFAQSWTGHNHMRQEWIIPSGLQGWGACGAKPGVTGLHKDGGASWLEAKCCGLDCTACGQHREASSRWLEEQQVGEASCRAIFINCKLYGFI